MSRNQAAVAPSTVTALARIKQDPAITAAIPLKARVQAVIPTVRYPNVEAYAQADALLGKVLTLKDSIEVRFGEILDPLNAARTSTLRLKKDVIDPVESSEQWLRSAMSVWKRDELAEQQKQERTRQEEQRKLQAAQEEIERKAAAAKTPQVASRLMNKAVALEEQITEVMLQPPPQPVRVQGSTTRKVWKWRADLAQVVEAVAKGEVPLEVLQIDAAYVNGLMRLHGPEGINALSGFEAYEDVQVVAR